MDADRWSGEGDGLWPRKAAAAASPEFDIVRVMTGDPGIDLEGGSEFKSGAIEDLFYGLG